MKKTFSTIKHVFDIKVRLHEKKCLILHNFIIYNMISTRKGLLALSPIIVFLILYLAVSIAVNDFYKMPISVSFIIASIWSIITSSTHEPLKEKLNIFSKGAANPDILYMIWIFILAGAFASLAKETGAIDATVNFTLQILPPQFIIPGIFIASCFISLSIGTSVGTIVSLTPFALQLAESTGQNIPFFVAAVIGGSFFGDNLSFISDTTIAATRSQGCKMNDKFKANLAIAIPAAILVLIIYVFIGQDDTYATIAPSPASPFLVIPYLIIIGLAVAGINVIVVLTTGIIASIITALCFTDIHLADMCSYMGNGINDMGNLIVVTLLAAGMLAMIKHNGGIDFLMNWLTRHINGKRGAQSTIAILVSIVNLCTANNTIAIITVGELSRKISEKYNIEPRKVAGTLDTCSCIVQCLIPYGAQVLLAAGLAKVSPVAFFPYLYYAWALAAMVILSIIFQFPKSKHSK